MEIDRTHCPPRSAKLDRDEVKIVWEKWLVSPSTSLLHDRISAIIQ